MIKMGGFFQRQFANTAAKASPRLRARMMLGKNILRGGKDLLSLGDKGLGAVSEALFSPGGPTAGRALDAAGKTLNKLPLRGQVALAGGIPAYFLLKQQAAANNLVPYLNASIEEGRQVYANDEEFLKKKEELQEKLAVNLTELFQGLGHGLGAGAKGLGEGVQAMHGIGSLAGEAANKAGIGASMLQKLGPGMMLGGGLAGLGGLIGGALKSPAAKPFQETAGYQANRAMNPLLDRVKYDETFADSFFKNLGSEAAKGISGLLQDVKEKALTALRPEMGGEQMVQSLMVDDPILSRGEPSQMLNAYHTMSKFAPTLATDENAVRSFLREAVMAGTGPDYTSISNLAKAEANIRNAMNPYPRKQD